VLAELVEQVYSLEIIPELARGARKRLERMGYGNVSARVGDGHLGWPEHAPCDRIVVTAAATHIPRPLVEQLGPGGRLVIPVGLPNMSQELMVVEKDTQGATGAREILGVAFVPLIGGGRDGR